jgi:hypothetical protein
MEAASRTVFTCIRERTFCTCYGDWFPILCAPIAATLLIAQSRGARTRVSALLPAHA